PGWYTPGYVAESGFRGTLVPHDHRGGCNLVNMVAGAWRCITGEYRPDKYVYSDPYGRIYTMTATVDWDGLSQHAALSQMADVNGNRLTYDATGIHSNFG